MNNRFVKKIKNPEDIENIKENNTKLTSQDLELVGKSGTYMNNREVTKRFEVQSGYYVVIPSTYESDVNSKFMLRIYTEEAIELE